MNVSQARFSYTANLPIVLACLQSLSMFKIVILVFIVVTGWVVLSGRTTVKDPHVNFRNAFEGSSHSGNDVGCYTFLPR